MSWIKDARPLFLTGHKKEAHCEESGANFIFVLANSPFQTIKFFKKRINPLLYFRKFILEDTDLPRSRNELNTTKPDLMEPKMKLHMCEICIYR